MSNLKVFQVFGVVTLAGGRHVSTSRATSSATMPSGNKDTNHIMYNYMAYGTKPDTVTEGTLRFWTHPKTVLLPDNTLAYIHGKAHAPAHTHGATLNIECVHLVAFPGDPSDDTYEKSVPNFGALIVVALGITDTGTSDNVDGRSFDLAVSDYVRNGIAESTITYVAFFLLYYTTGSHISIHKLHLSIDSTLGKWS